MVFVAGCLLLLICPALSVGSCTVGHFLVRQAWTVFFKCGLACCDLAAVFTMDPAKFDERLQEIAAIQKKEVPEDDKEIFKFKYEARAQLVALQAELLTLDDTSNRTSIVQTARLHLALGLNYIEAEELGEGETNLKIAQKHMHNFRGAAMIEETDAGCEIVTPGGADIDPSQDHVLVDIYNQRGFLWSTRGDDAKAEKFLKASESLYNSTASKTASIEDSYCSTVFFLAQVYSNLKKQVLASQYCMMTLQKQLLTKKEFDKVEWTSNCLHLSGFYLGCENFSMADYCLRSAQHVISTVQGHDSRIEANMHIAVAKYYHQILKVSWNRKEAGSEAPLVDGHQDGVFDLPIPAPIDKLPMTRTFEEAREIFKLSLPKFEKSLEYYNFDDECTAHIDVKADIGALWRTLINYEADIERQVSMHKRRVALYEPLVNRLNIQAYMPYVRKLTYELGEIWNEIGDIRASQAQGKPSKGGKKINEASLACIRYFELFLTSFLDDQLNNQDCELPECETTQKSMPSKMEEDYYRTFIMANMHIARQYTRMQCADYEEAAGRVMKAKERYEWALKAATEYEITAEHGLVKELEMCSEMSALLPGKLKELRKVYPS